MLLFITLPENTEVLRTAAELLEAAEEASAAYSNYIASVNGDVIEVCPDDAPICDDAPIEVEAIRAPDYAGMTVEEAALMYLTINGPSTIRQISDGTGKRYNSVSNVSLRSPTFSDAVNRERLPEHGTPFVYSVKSPEPVEPEIDYAPLSARETVTTYLSIHGEGTIEAIADASGKNRDTIYGACHTLTMQNAVTKTLGNGDRFTHTYKLREQVEAAPVEDDVVVEQVEKGVGVQGYESMTVRAAIRHYFMTTNNRPTSAVSVAEATGLNAPSVCTTLSTYPEFRNVERGTRIAGSGAWALSADMYRQGWMVVGR